MATLQANIVLHDNQRAIDRNDARFKVIKAGKRFGKTKWAVYAVVKAAAAQPGSTIWYVAPTYRQAKSIAWLDLLNVTPQQIIKRKLESELMLELSNGSRIYLIGADNEDSLRGTALDGLVMDEAAYCRDYIWPAILSGQLLGGKGKPFAYFISSPNSKGKNWFTNFHKEAEVKMLSGDKDWAAFYYTIYDNPTLDKNDIEIVHEQTTDDVWQTEYMAIESSSTGPLVPEFDNKKHVVNGNIDLTNLVLVRGIDWGINHPTTCLWVGFDRSRNSAFVFKEFYKTGYLINESCQAINQMTGKMPIDWTVIDPSTNKRNSQTGRTDKDEFSRYGIYCLPGDNRDRGIHVMRMFFKKDLIKIHSSCKNLINELRTYQLGEKEGDDCLDPLRYVLLRAHDYMFGGKLFDPESHFDRPKIGYSLFDKSVFRPEESSFSWEGL